MFFQKSYLGISSGIIGNSWEILQEVHPKISQKVTPTLNFSRFFFSKYSSGILSENVHGSFQNSCRYDLRNSFKNFCKNILWKLTRFSSKDFSRNSLRNSFSCFYIVYFSDSICNTFMIFFLFKNFHSITLRLLQKLLQRLSHYKFTRASIRNFSGILSETSTMIP